MQLVEHGVEPLVPLGEFFLGERTRRIEPIELVEHLEHRITLELGSHRFDDERRHLAGPDPSTELCQDVLVDGDGDPIGGHSQIIPKV